MVAKGTKRPTSAANSSVEKKGRVDPMFAGIIATLQSADDMSEKCREMLIAMAAPCLSTPKSERHNVQALGVRQIEETLQDHKKKLIQAVDVAQKQLTELEGSKNALMKAVEDAKASLEEKKASFVTKQAARVEAEKSATAAKNALAEAADLQAKGDAKFNALEEEKAAIDAAYQEHFKAPMDANEGPHYSFLTPFIKNLGLEDSLANAVPSSCDKTKEQRGSFDDLVLAELGKALVGKIAALEKSIADEVCLVSERKATVVSAEAVLESSNLAETAAVADLETAETAQQEAEAVLQSAEGDWSTFEPRVQEATDNHRLHDTMRMDFEEGALKDFTNFRDKEAPVPVEEEAATAGA